MRLLPPWTCFVGIHFSDQQWVAEAFQDLVYLDAVSGFRGLDYAASRYPQSGTSREGFKVTFADDMVERLVGLWFSRLRVAFEIGEQLRNRSGSLKRSPSAESA